MTISDGSEKLGVWDHCERKDGVGSHYETQLISFLALIFKNKEVV